MYFGSAVLIVIWKSNSGPEVTLSRSSLVTVYLLTAMYISNTACFRKDEENSVFWREVKIMFFLQKRARPDVDKER